MTFHARTDETSEWLSYLQPEGLVVGANVLREKALSPIRQTPLDTEEAAKALGLAEDAPREDDRHFVLREVWPFLEPVLGWPARLVAGAPGGPALSSSLSITAPEHETLLAPDMAVLWNGEPEGELPAQALVMLHPGLDPDGRNQFPGEWEASPHQRLERLLRETNVGVGILVAKNTLRLVYAPRGETAGWMSWPLAALGRVEGRPMLAGLKLCLGRNTFFTGAAETRLRALLKASREAQNEVSEKLSGQVLGALHELLRGLHRADPDGIEALAEHDAHHLYEGILTCLMRLVFLLYAEDRDLLPSATEPRLRQLWESGYSIKTLYARLLTDEALNPDTMDERRGGWGQLLAVFRLIHDGHPGWIARRGGKLFDPDAFPFLEGREKGSARTDARVLPFSDGTILRILHGLMTIEGRSQQGARIRERLSYRSLDVESIGSVYETVMGFTADRAAERMVALRGEKKLPTFVGLDTLLAQRPADRAKWLKDHSVKLSARQTAGVKAATDEAALLEALGSLVDERASPRGTPIGAGAPFLQPTEERRRSGSHYTPRSLTEPIVRHALEPAFARIGPGAGPEAVLGLRVLDLACGSGAFLVEACRQLGGRLEQAWDMHPAEKPPIPPDEDAATHARRLVAQKCLYGVDRNPMAVDLARLSLWLTTLAREHEFQFLDHALKSGDSIVGLTKRQIKAANWDASKPSLPLFRDTIERAVGSAREGREAIRNAGDDALTEAQAARYIRVQDASEVARIVGDVVIASFFAADKPRARELQRQTVESWIAGSVSGDREKLQTRANAFYAEHGWQPFHWEIEFPEVFARDDPGFDAIVGNPPFLGAAKIWPIFGGSYVDWIKSTHPNTGGKGVDLIAHFFRQAYVLLRDAGTLGLIATNKIGQGDTRTAGLKQIRNHAGHIYRATRRLPWPGSAAVVVSVIHVSKGREISPNFLDEEVVLGINSLLMPVDEEIEPRKLASNSGMCFRGCDTYGTGFIFTPAGGPNSAGSISDLTRIIASDISNDERIFPFIGGREVATHPRHVHDRFAINFADMSLTEAERWPELLQIVRAKVKPERDKLTGYSVAERRKENWWQYGTYTPALYRAVSSLPSVMIVGAGAVIHHMIAIVPSRQVFSHKTMVFASSNLAFFAVLQSGLHELWSRSFGTTFGSSDALTYNPLLVFRTFPFPPVYEADPALEAAGQAYHDHRAALMVEADEGMTKTYNRFHDPAERRPAVQRLRELHDEMDRAVLRAYGWNDLADTLRPVFLTPETEDDHTYQSRYFWPAEGRDLVLSRLLALNAKRHAEEVEAGLAPAKVKRSEAEDGESELDLG